MCSIFLKRGLFKAIKNDTPMCQTRKYTNTNTQIHKYTISQSARKTYFWKGDCSRMSSESHTVVQGLVFRSSWLCPVIFMQSPYQSFSMSWMSPNVIIKCLTSPSIPRITLGFFKPLSSAIPFRNWLTSLVFEKLDWSSFPCHFIIRPAKVCYGIGDSS